MEKKISSSGATRPPIVVILGHVDHGKTTLLDNVRSTNVAAKEAGGITQSIGASEVSTKEGKQITFIDTPGHAAFSNMRARGAKLSDIAILVVAAGDGVKPQTKEALEYILEAKIPFIVAATKIDLPTANLETVRSQLEKEGVLFEGRGGDVPLLGVSGKTGKGVQELLEMITLVSELNDIKGDPEGSLEALIVETGKDNRGPTATCVVRNGQLEVGCEIVSEIERIRVRGLFDWNEKPVQSVGPGEPALVLGFKNVPPVGSRIWGVDQKEILPTISMQKKSVGISVEEGQIPIVIKAQNAGTLEAVISNLPGKIVVLASGVGDVTESDIFLAKSSNALIFTFESKTPHQVRKLAETEGISIESFTIIYELFERLEEIIEKGKVEILGRAEVLAEFPYNAKKIAGCKIIQGKITKKDALILTRGDKKIGEMSVISLKKGREDIVEAKQGEECGIIFSPQLDFKIGDVILSVRK
ncbi:hypothetical protein A2715_03305 [Candidatus Woesebacteria bacterium RIFCSPHIGHO2_01_FULL_39_32]|uniref:Tr-type G domain-containing protein n=1 Tax=Candidatus Woesebacteria bacterium RIFCSPLOWO2_01_FULL_39_25 TaxID=1802521 RepID=A0A1F8BKP1_9BACT|nr:MAG: hypothetical protein A2124_02745 [Candidatus Woesebacteria bacterium GWB1_37_5]OGM24766.1 MAG: hypothetical protein A2715_03305 [Candidatus Woesebacteria bacterium RIFCSPHIGHO2_01_FULL_39_32]OGM37088.1 MAG: hypothetical protein A3F01_05245 [Candidatus Woesebacteria bacterium RIFCSPHIGHO2_12_FULL_38_11]OGM64592.1 MAG: hypothetical protein A2893_06220 [Candidatus Woesebacteria bacterium RIFCSPLOWO2_01_FULL_39_25]